MNKYNFFGIYYTVLLLFILVKPELVKENISFNILLATLALGTINMFAIAEIIKKLKEIRDNLPPPK